MLIARDQPVVETPHAFTNANLRFPPCEGTKFVSVRHVVTLVRGAPVFEVNRNLTAVQLSDQVEQLEQTDRVRWSTTDVESVSREVLHVLLAQQERVNQVVDEENVAHLFAVAVDADRLSGERTNDEVGHPALIFITVLVRAVDAAH